MIPIKTKKEILIMQQGGKRLADICAVLLEKIKPGISGLEIEAAADKLIKKSGGVSSFKMVKNYQYNICLCINDVVVHGVPTKEIIKDGDLVGLDIGLYYKDFHTDMSWSVVLGEKNTSAIRFLEIGKKTLEKAVKMAYVGNYIGDISQTIDKTIRMAGYKPVRSVIGHGVGKKLHENPEIPCFYQGNKQQTPLLKNGMTLAIEVIYNEKDSRIVYKNDDGWSIATLRNDLSGLFELSVAVTDDQPLVLTASNNFVKISKLNT